MNDCTPLYSMGCWLVGFKAHWGPVNCNVALNYPSNDTHFALKSDLDRSQIAEGWEISNERTWLFLKIIPSSLVCL